MTEARATPASLWWRIRLATRALELCLVALGAAIAETVSIVVRSPDVGQRLAFSLGTFAQLQVAALAMAVLTSLFWLALERLVSRLREQGLLRAPSPYTALDFAAAALILAPLVVLALYRVLLELLTSLKNRELAVLAGAVSSLLIACLAVVLWAGLSAAIVRTRRRLATRPSWLVLIPGALLSLAAAGRLGASAGVAQLDPWLLAAPGAALALLPGRARLARAVARGRPALALTFVVAGSLLATLASRSTPATPEKSWRAGAWSRPAVALLRRMSDFDRDGYSGWFGGGDCAPFDARVHPGAREIPLDGVDNNCLGGDGRSRPLSAQPRAAGRTHAGLGPRLDLVLVTIETLRADHVSFLGYARATTPRLSELAQSSVVFERSYATTPTTRLSLAALLSGLLPSSIHWLNQAREKQMRRIAPDNPWLPALLSQQGYMTLAVHANFRAFTQAESAGFERGFARYDVSTQLAYSGGTMHGFPGQAQVDRALGLLDETAARPLFLWLHLLEPHYLYQQSPAVPHFGDDERSRYDAEIAEVDRQVGRLLDGLRARGSLEQTLLIVTGDHGEEFGEHGQRWHGSNLYEPQLRTATLLRMPGLAARRIAEPVSILDIAPTVLDLLGIEGGFERAMGRDLVPLLRESRAIERGFLLENFKVDDGSQALLGVLDWPFKLLRTGPDQNFELYDLGSDPGETHNLWQADEPTSRRLADRLFRYLESDLPNGATENGKP